MIRPGVTRTFVLALHHLTPVLCAIAKLQCGCSHPYVFTLDCRMCKPCPCCGALCGAAGCVYNRGPLCSCQGRPTCASLSRVCERALSQRHGLYQETPDASHDSSAASKQGIAGKQSVAVPQCTKSGDSQLRPAWAELCWFCSYCCSVLNAYCLCVHFGKFVAL